MPLDVTIDQIEKFSKKFSIVENGCWDWIGLPRNKNTTRGVFYYKYKHYSAYKFIYEQIYGSVPDGLTLDHLCGRPVCVNPKHLEAVTQAENVRRYNEKITHCPRGHEYKNIPKWAAKRNRKYCNPCHAIRESERRKRLAS